MTRDDLPRPCFWKKGRERSFCCCYSHSRGSVCSGGHEVGSRSAPSGGLGVFPDSTDIPCQSAVSLRMGQVQIPSSKQQQKRCGERSVKNLAHPRLPPQSGDVDHQRKKKERVWQLWDDAGGLRKGGGKFSDMYPRSVKIRSGGTTHVRLPGSTVRGSHKSFCSLACTLQFKLYRLNRRASDLS